MIIEEEPGDKYDDKTSSSVFEGLIKTIKKKMRGGILKHNKGNVDLIIEAIRAAPFTEEYPHPTLNRLFEAQMAKLEMGNECVASWASLEAKGLKTKDGAELGNKEIIGVYGGVRTRNKGIYVLDVTTAGSDQILVDGDPCLSTVNQFGLMNEDILLSKRNIGLDVGGIIYTKNKIKEREELLTSYGGEYKWGHVMQVGLDRLRSDLGEKFPSIHIDIPPKLEDLKESHMLEGWIKGLVCGGLPERSIHSTWDPHLPEDSVEGFVSYVTSNVAFNRYAFKRCGRLDLQVKDTGRETVGRKFVEYLDRLKEDRIPVPTLT